eukprot:4439592-Pyramimonas_sp.AAC.1
MGSNNNIFNVIRMPMYLPHVASNAAPMQTSVRDSMASQPDWPKGRKQSPTWPRRVTAQPQHGRAQRR